MLTLLSSLVEKSLVLVDSSETGMRYRFSESTRAYALDNLSDEVTPWAQTGYRFVKRQSQEDPNIWVALGEPTEAPLYTAR